MGVVEGKLGLRQLKWWAIHSRIQTTQETQMNVLRSARWATISYVQPDSKETAALPFARHY